MSDDAGRFQVRSEGNVAIPVSNSTSMTILDILEDSDLTLSDISCRSGIPTSTVFFNLKSMMKNGLISSYSDRANGKKAVYSLSSIKLLAFGEAKVDALSSVSTVLMRAVSDPSYMYRGMLTFIALSCFRGGMDVTPTFSHMGRLLADRMKGFFKSDNFEDLMEEMFAFGRKTGMPSIRLHNHVPFTLAITPEIQLDEKFLSIYATYMGFITQVLENNLGTRYVLESNRIADDGDVHMILVPAENGFKPHVAADPVGTDAVMKPFMILYRGDQPMLIDNRNQVDIVRVLAEQDCTSMEISEKTGIPIQTVYSNLSRMVNDKVVSSHMNDAGSGPMYRFDLHITLYAGDSTDVSEDYLDPLMVQTMEHPMYFFQNLLICLTHLFDTLGISWSESIRYIGGAMAQGMMIGKSVDKSGDFLGEFFKERMPFGSRVSFVSHFPLTFEVELDQSHDSILDRYIRDFYDGFFQSMFDNLSFVKCVARRIENESNPKEFNYTVVYLE